MSAIRNSFSPIIALFAIALIAATSQPEPRRETISSPANQEDSGCQARAFVHMAFLIDRSGSLDPAERGQTFNMQIEGIVRALRDPALIPRDGSVAISVFTFAETPTLQLPLTEIKSSTDAESAASQVEALKCDALKCDREGPTACPVKGNIPASNFGAAISAAYRHLSQAGLARNTARRVLVISSDGGCTDEGCGLGDRNAAKADAARLGIGFELDTILVGLKSGTPEHTYRKKDVDPIAFPEPPGDLPGKTITIEAGDCNIACICEALAVARGATLDIEAGDCNDAKRCLFVADCARQADTFADHVRRILRSDVTDMPLTVNTSEDTPADETPEMIAAQNIISLRRAITLANARGGKATITFVKDVTRIEPTTLLPAITQPDVTIDGDNAVTIDGSMIAQEGEVREDGLLIRTGRTTIRGMRIINFRGAGIAIDPLPGCSVGRNDISRNHLENNTKAGILVLDLLGEPGSNLRNTLSENTISGESIPTENTISGESIPIDLGGDGPTANDVCDGDEGPNHLLNYPESFMATVEGNSVRIEGRAGSDPCPVAGAKVEIFAVTIPDSAAAQSSVRTVTPVVTVLANSEGRFTLSVANAAVIGYTATVTDAEGNTSEMIPFCTAPPVAVIEVEELEFGPISARGSLLKLKKQPSADFTIANAGCSGLTARFVSIERDEQEGITNRDDHRQGRGLFSVRRITDDPPREEEVPFGQDVLAIAPRAFVRFRVRFNPVIPAPARCGCSASQVLPREVNSTLTISFNDGTRRTIALTGRVKPEPRLINPDPPRLPAKVTLNRSGDELTVTFSVYDSDRDVEKVRYEFFDGQQNPVPVDIEETDLREAIAHLVKGQSFTAAQKFSNARQHPGVSTVRVTVTDGQKKIDTALSSPLVSAATRLRSADGESSASPLRAGRPSVLQIPLRAASGKNERKGRQR